MFSDAVAAALFKSASEVGEIEDESAAENSRRKKRALIGAGVTAAAIGGLALGTYMLASPAEAVGAGLAKATAGPKEPTILGGAKALARNSLSWVGATGSVAVAAGAVSGMVSPSHVARGEIGHLAHQLALSDDKFDARKPTFAREFVRGMALVPGQSQADVAADIRSKLPALSPGVSADNIRLGLSGLLSRLGAGSPSEALASKEFPTAATATVAPKVPHNMHNAVSKFRELLTAFDASEAAHVRGQAGLPVTQADIDAKSKGVIARDILANLGKEWIADPKAKAGPAPKPSNKPVSSEEVKRQKKAELANKLRNANLAADALRLVAGKSGDHHRVRSMTRNAIPRFLGGGLTGALLSATPTAIRAFSEE